ncbi:MAG TPA: hypothetical protein DIW46_00590 [Microbacterium sp.]|nr:hypothetical protein [Microbacterium sp.]
MSHGPHFIRRSIAAIAAAVVVIPLGLSMGMGAAVASTAVPSVAAEVALVDVISQGRPVSASSEESSELPAGAVVDNVPTTRWASEEGVAPQWITIDLGTGASVSKVVLQWEEAFASKYRVELSADGATWTTLATVSAGDGATDEHANLTGTGRYLRVYGTERGTQWGYSLWSVEVYGTPGDTAPTDPETGTTVNVSTAAQLSDALADAEPGQTITLSEGTYRGSFVATQPGTAEQPITLTGPRSAVLINEASSGSLSGCPRPTSGWNSGYGLWLFEASHWNVNGVTIADSKKGIVLDAATHVSIDGVLVRDIAEEGVHFRRSSADGVIRNSEIMRTGLVKAGYGEGLYLGSSKSNFNCYADSSGFDRSDRVQVLDNDFGPGIAAEHIDIKEGTHDGIVRGNTFDGQGLSGENSADSWIDAKGNDYLIEGNTGSFAAPGTFANGYETHNLLEGFGCGNVWKNNDSDLGGVGDYAIRVSSTSKCASNPNTVYDSNTVTNANSGLTNVAVTPSGETPGDIDPVEEAPSANETLVTSISQLQTAIDSADAGDTIVLEDGTYSVSSSAPISVAGGGSAGNPVTIKAETVGGVTLTGSASFVFDEAHDIKIEGFVLTQSTKLEVPADSRAITFSRDEFVFAQSAEHNLMIRADDSVVEYSWFHGKNTIGVYLGIEGAGSTEMATGVRVHHNYFSDQNFTGANGGESIRLGVSPRALSVAGAIIEYNLFENANGDPEAISVKSSGNTIRYNTIRNSFGGIVLRHGNDNTVVGNRIIDGSKGIRIYGNDHAIINNYIAGIDDEAIVVGSGTLRDHYEGEPSDSRRTNDAPDRIRIALNTLVNNGDGIAGETNRTVPPLDVTIVDNIIQGATGSLADVPLMQDFYWRGNILWGSASDGNIPKAGYSRSNPQLAQDAAGTWRPGSTSPAIDAANQTNHDDWVTDDIDGRARSGTFDVGSHEVTTAAATRAPLTTADVGPEAG